MKAIVWIIFLVVVILALGGWFFYFQKGDLNLTLPFTEKSYPKPPAFPE